MCETFLLLKMHTKVTNLNRGSYNSWYWQILIRWQIRIWWIFHMKSASDGFWLAPSHPCNIIFRCSLHCVSKKVPTFKLCVTLSNLNRFSKILHCWKAYEICYKTVRCYPHHLRHVATLLWEIENSNFLQIFSRYGRKSKQIAF